MSAEVTHRVAAFGQIGISILYLVGYFVVLFVVLFGLAPESALKWEKMLTALLGVLTAGVVQILSYWFSRQRASVTGPEEGEK